VCERGGVRAGVLVIRPREHVWRWLLEQANSVSSYDGSDQGFLNTVFPDWWQVSLNPDPEPETLNPEA